MTANDAVAPALRALLDAPRGGWDWLFNAKKSHYFEPNGTSLCGRWFRFGGTGGDQNDDHWDNCAACRKVRATRRTKGAELLARIASADREGAMTTSTNTNDARDRDLVAAVRERWRTPEVAPGDPVPVTQAAVREDIETLARAFDRRGAAVADALVALTDLLEVAVSGDELRLLLVGVNGQAMSDPKNENSRALLERAARVTETAARARAALDELRRA